MTWLKLLALGIVFALMTVSASACATSIGSGVTEGNVNPFCAAVGPPPAHLIPPSGAPPEWIDDYLAVYDVECDG